MKETFRILRILIQKEFRDAVRSRWLLCFGGIFILLALGLSWAGSLTASMGGYSGFGRTTAALLNLVMLIVPLLALALGSMSVVHEREKGTLSILLALPVSATEVFWAKFAGLSAALFISLTLAFGVAGLGLALSGGLRDGTHFLKSFLVTLPLAWVSLALGFWITSFSKKTAAAVGLIFSVWLVLVLGGDLGLLGSSLAMKIRPEVLLATTLLNPMSLYRLAAIDLLGAHLEMLGPAGHCAQDILGAWLLPAAISGMILWTIVLMAVSYRIYIRDPLRT